MISDTHSLGGTARVVPALLTGRAEARLSATGACGKKLKKEKAGGDVGVTYSNNGEYCSEYCSCDGKSGY
jgi:hypothetical protein